MSSWEKKKKKTSECEEFLRIQSLPGDLEGWKVPGNTVTSRWFKYVQHIFLGTEVPIYPALQNCSLQMLDGTWGRAMSLNPDNIKGLSPGCSLSYLGAFTMLNTCRLRCCPKNDADVQYSWGFILIILIATTIVWVLSPERTCGDKSNNYTIESRYLK